MIGYKWMGPAIIPQLPCNRNRLLTLDFITHFGYTEKEMESWVTAGIFIKRDLPEDYDGPMSKDDLAYYCENHTKDDCEKVTAQFNLYWDEVAEAQRITDARAKEDQNTQNLNGGEAQNKAKKASGGADQAPGVTNNA